MMRKLYIKLYALLCMIKKEMLAILKDPASRFILIAPVFVQAFLFGYTATYNLEHVPYALYDESQSSYSIGLVSHLDGGGLFERVQTLSSSDEMADVINTGDAMIVIHIEQQFADHLSHGKSGVIQIITDGRNPTTGGLAASYAASIASNYVQSLNSKPGLIQVKTRTWYNPNQITQWMFLPSLIPIIALVQVLLLSGLSVARERENGTFEQLLVTPLRPYQILIGKAIPPILIGIMQATIMLAIIVFWFKIEMVGSLVVMYTTILLFLISTVGIGLSISAVSKNMQQVMVYNFTLLLPMMILSGLATPVSNMPTFLQYLTYVNPIRFAIECIRRIYLEGAGFDLICINYIPLIIVASVTMPLAAWLFRHKLS